MGSLKTLTIAFWAAIALAPPAHAMMDLPRLFASCAGQFSATVSASWLTRDPARERLEADYATFEMLLDAMGLAEDPATLSLRIEAKAAQAALLQDAHFGTDRNRAAQAARRANAQISTCRLLLLDS